MAVYVFGQAKEYARAELDYGQTYNQQMLGEIACSVRYVCADIVGQNEIELYEKAGIDAGKILGLHQFLTGSRTACPSIKAKDKLMELKACFEGARVEERESEIWLVKDGYVIVSILLDERDKSLLKGVSYFSRAKLLRMEIYTDRVSYANYYMTAKSEHGLYAKLVRRSFYREDGSVAYDQIFEGEKEWYVFPDGRRYTKQQLITRFVRELSFSNEDVVILDASVPQEIMRTIFTFGRAARIVAAVHTGNYFAKDENGQALFLKEYPYYWFPYSEMIDSMIVPTEAQKKELLKVLKKHRCTVPGIRVVPIEGEFTYTVLNESYGENLALSWVFSGKSDGFWIYDELGELICETRNEHQHYFLIEGYGKESGFVVKAFVDTVKGKRAIAESGVVYCACGEGEYGKLAVSLIIPAYNAEDYIGRAMDNALAQSLKDLEIIVVDDGSTDSTSDILDWYVECYPNVNVIHKENGGVAAARNTGIEAAGGEYSGFMDSDDMIRPDMMKMLYDSAKKNDCDVAITSFYTITQSGYVGFMEYAVNEDTGMPVEMFFKRNFVSGYGIVVWNKLYRTSLIKKHLFPVLLYEDEAWTPYIFSYVNKVCFLNKHFYEYDRIIRSNTLADQLNEFSRKRKFVFRKNAMLFYLENGNQKRIELLKKITQNCLNSIKGYYSQEECEEFWREVEKDF
jgi:glycosyltransferase involved in cell wall biosynthesis